MVTYVQGGGGRQICWCLTCLNLFFLYQYLSARETKSLDFARRTTPPSGPRRSEARQHASAQDNGWHGAAHGDHLGGAVG